MSHSTRNRQPALPQPYRGKRFLDRPEVGWFKLKLVRRGPWVPALIWQPCPMVWPQETTESHYLGDDQWAGNAEPPDAWCCPTDPWRSPRWLKATVGDRDVDPLEVWSRGSRISAAEYYWRLALREWAQAQPDQPEAKPRAPVDLTATPSLF